MSPLLLGLTLVAGAPALKDKPNAQDLYGEWEAADRPGPGRATAADGPPYRWRFNRDGTWQVFKGDKEVCGKRGFRADPTADPPTLDFNTPPVDPVSHHVLAIYKIEGDRLTVCCAYQDVPRPSILAAPPGSGTYLNVYRRVKPKD